MPSWAKGGRTGGLFGGRLPWVLVGLCVIVAAITLFADARKSEEGEIVANAQLQATADQSAEFASQLLAACDSSAGVELRQRGLCQRAAQVQAQPIAGPRGDPGATGERGASGERGPMGPMGPAGPAPPCMSEPNQCRGQDGRPGVDGKDGVDGQDGKDGANGQDGRDGERGPAGGSCPEGETREPYLYPDGVQGSRCVAPAPAAPPEDAAPVEQPP